MDALINGETVYLTPLMVNMRTERRYPIGAESYGFWCLTIGFEVNFFTSHSISLFSGNLVPVVQALFSSRNTLYTTQQKLSDQSEYQS